MTATYVRVRLGLETYALSVVHVNEVAALNLPTPVPGAVPALLGVYNLRGAILPVYDLCAILCIEGPATRTRLVVTEANGQRVGLAVDAVEDVAELSVLAERTESGLLEGEAIIDDKLVGFIDVLALFELLRAQDAA